MAPESSLSEATRAALNNSQVIDLTTTGRRTGQLRRIEIFLHNDHGQLFIAPGAGQANLGGEKLLLRFENFIITGLAGNISFGGNAHRAIQRVHFP